MEGIFISYRREESAGHAGRIYDRLREKFGKSRVFMDVSAIEPGVDFVEAIDRAVGSCTVLLVVIGRRWIDCTNAAGRRRLDDPKDFIRLEVGSALRRTIRVIPVLVQNAEMPEEEALPEELKLLARRNAIEINDNHWDSDLGQLVETLEKVMAGGTEAAPSTGGTVKKEEGGKKNRLTWLISSITAVLLALTGLFTGIDSFRDAFVKLFKGSPPVTTSTGKTPPEPDAPAPTQKPVATATVTAPDSPAAQPQKPPKVQEPKKPPKAPAAKPVVPNLVGLTLEKAEIELMKQGFRMAVGGKQESSEMPAGTVLRHFPKAGDRLEPGGTVELVIAAAPAEPEMATMPNVVRQPLERAVQMLKEAGLQPGKETPRPVGEIRPGTVVQQSVRGDSRIKAGSQVKRGTIVDLWVAVPPKEEPPQPPVVTPAVKVLAKGNLKVRQTYLFDLDSGREVQSGDSDIWFEAVTATERYLTPRNGATMGIARGTGDFTGCSRAKMSENRFPVDKLPPSITVCVKTNRGNLGAFRLLEPVGPSPGVLKISYIVWE